MSAEYDRGGNLWNTIQKKGVTSHRGIPPTLGWVASAHLLCERSRRELSNGGKMTSVGTNGVKLWPFSSGQASPCKQKCVCVWPFGSSHFGSSHFGSRRKHPAQNGY